jgi:hypothetical protein
MIILSPSEPIELVGPELESLRMRWAPARVRG